MIDIRSGLGSVTDRGAWAARGASFMTKVKATKAVWFPPEPVESGKKTASAAKKATKQTARKTAGTAKKTTGGAAKKSTGAAKKTSKSAASKANGAVRKSASRQKA